MAGYRVAFIIVKRCHCETNMKNSDELATPPPVANPRSPVSRFKFQKKNSDDNKSTNKPQHYNSGVGWHSYSTSIYLDNKKRMKTVFLFTFTSHLFPTGRAQRKMKSSRIRNGSCKPSESPTLTQKRSSSAQTAGPFFLASEENGLAGASQAASQPGFASPHPRPREGRL